MQLLLSPSCPGLLRLLDRYLSLMLHWNLTWLDLLSRLELSRLWLKLLLRGVTLELARLRDLALELALLGNLALELALGHLALKLLRMALLELLWWLLLVLLGVDARWHLLSTPQAGQDGHQGEHCRRRRPHHRDLVPLVPDQSQEK